MIRIFILSVLLFSCHQEISVSHPKKNPQNLINVFEAFWKGMNLNYVYWDVDTTNWDRVYEVYYPLFANLDINNLNDLNKSKYYFEKITAGLIDSHYLITFQYPGLSNSFISPSSNRIHRGANYHAPFYYAQLVTTYLNKGYLVGDYSTKQGQYYTNTVCGSIEDSILYFSCSSFFLYRAYSTQEANNAKKVIRFFIDELSNFNSKYKGLIIDIRGNGGGDLVDLTFLVGQLIDKPLHFGYVKYKNGNGRLDYTPWLEAYVNPNQNSKQINSPIIVLADNASASLSEAVVMAIHSLSNGRVVGETTWGATSPITVNVIYNSGSFTIPYFMDIQASSAMFKYLDGNIYEGVGFPPDVIVPFDSLSIKSGRDRQLEAAISILK